MYAPKIYSLKHPTKFACFWQFILLAGIAGLSACIQLSSLEERIKIPDSDFSIRVPEGYEVRNSDGLLHIYKRPLANNPRPQFRIFVTRLNKMPGDTLENHLGQSVDAEDFVKCRINDMDVYVKYEEGVGDQLATNTALISDGAYLLNIVATSTASNSEEAQHLLEAMIASIGK